MYKNKKTAENIHLKAQLIIAFLITLLGIGLFVAGFAVPPLGEIDGSVLVAGGEAFTFVGALVGVDYSYRFKVYASRNGNI